MKTNGSASIGIVAIGRNEGLRLQRCLESLQGCGATVVYVDSGSTDGSRELARSMGAAVVELDTSTPFTAARARNAGFEHLLRTAPEVEFVQFIDGDCALQPGWLDCATAAMREHQDLVVVCGRRRERHPERTVYNRLCDIEWDTPIGRSRACGGDALMRSQAVRGVGGYDPTMIAGEEPDLCLRLQRNGGWILRQDAEMTLHDAAMTRWTQWWQRAVRTGHTSAELLAKYGPDPEHRRLRRALSALFWAALVPICTITFAVWALSSGRGLLAAAIVAASVLLYAVLIVRIRRGVERSGRSPEDARAYSLSCALAKWPEVWGMLVFYARRTLRRQPRWIEYKEPPRESVAGGTDGA